MTPALEAAFRLSCALPKRTHHAKPYVPPESRRSGPKPLIVRGRRYPNLTAAAKGEKLGYRTIYRLMEKGEAGYL